MLTTTTSVVLGIAFVVLGGLNVWLVLEATTRIKAVKTSSRMLALHRIGGYLFIAVFFGMMYFMLGRMQNPGGDASPAVTLHMALAMVLSPLLFIKVLIARYYKNQYALLMPIGLSIFVVAFVLIADTVGPYLTRPSRVEQVSVDAAHARAVAIDLNQAGDLMQKRCSKCHNLDRVVGARKDANGWVATVNRMRLMPSASISESDADTIVSYLVSQNRLENGGDAARMEVARALVDQRCGRCHTLDRVYKKTQTPDQWRETVTRMVGYAAGSTGAIQPGEDRQIIEFLSATQTPEAASQRNAQVMAAASTGRSLIPDAAAAIPPPPPQMSHYDIKTIGYLSFVCLAVALLMMRRPGARVPAHATSRSPVPRATPELTVTQTNTPFILELVQITQQTPDSKTFRFAVRGQQKLHALPGQFLTFSFLFDGRKEIRCYSICSSPARSGYIEITPKRVNNGCVSVFLNDRAAIGMTVEATGPSGQFCFNPIEDKKIVLLAAGSGITPMMAMIRHLDDMCLDNESTLLYCVRSLQDVMFHRDLDELQTRHKNFRYHLLLSQPDAGWEGPKGHVSREFISKAIPEIRDRVFFLCGPPPFMQTARAILVDLGVDPGRIRQETFGGGGAAPKSAAAPSSATSFTIEFARSGKKTTILEGETLLEAAARSGVGIASACRQGQCGTCRTRLLEGDVEMRAEQGLDSDSKARGFILTCVARAKRDVKLDA